MRWECRPSRSGRQQRVLAIAHEGHVPPGSVASVRRHRHVLPHRCRYTSRSHERTVGRGRSTSRSSTESGCGSSDSSDDGSGDYGSHATMNTLRHQPVSPAHHKGGTDCDEDPSWGPERSAARRCLRFPDRVTKQKHSAAMPWPTIWNDITDLQRNVSPRPPLSSSLVLTPTWIADTSPHAAVIKFHGTLTSCRN